MSLIDNDSLAKAPTFLGESSWNGTSPASSSFERGIYSGALQ
jgi:hypothetical protein